MDISVYKILNKKTGKFYIGYSQETSKRFKSHVNMLKRKCHHCIHLQRAWDIDGEDAFEFIRLKIFERIQDAILEEQSQFDAYFKSGLMYNSVGTNDKTVAIKKAHTRLALQKNKESKRNSEAFKAAGALNRAKAWNPDSQRKRVETARRNGTLGQHSCVSVIARNEFKGDVKIFKSIAQAARELKLSSGNISMCCNGFRHRVGEYLFSYNLPIA